MKVVRAEEVPAEAVGEGAQGTTIRWLISKEMGAPNFAMRLFEIAPGGHTPLHQHPWEHEVYILSGTGCVSVVRKEGKTEEGGVWSASYATDLKPGTAVLVEPNEKHQFHNTGSEPLCMLCLVPHSEPKRGPGR